MLWFSKVDSSHSSASSVSVGEWKNWKGRLDNMGGAGVQRQHAFGVLLRRHGRKKFFENAWKWTAFASQKSTISSNFHDHCKAVTRQAKQSQIRCSLTNKQFSPPSTLSPLHEPSPMIIAPSCKPSPSMMAPSHKPSPMTMASNKRWHCHCVNYQQGWWHLQWLLLHPEAFWSPSGNLCIA